MKRFLIAVLLAVLCALFACASVFADSAEFDDDTVIVVMKPQIGAMRLMSSDSSGYDFGSLDVADVKKIAELDSESMSLFSIGNSTEEMLCLTLAQSGGDKVLEAVDALNGMDNVEYAQPNYVYHLDATVNDSYYSSQYALPKVGAPAVWDIGIDCSDTVIAVLDSGVKLLHEDLRDNLWADASGNTGWDFIGNDALPDDTVGHGTHVAGILSSVTNNRKGVASISGNAKIAVFKVFDDANSNTAAICEALQYMLDYEKKYGSTFSVVNCSFGGTAYDKSFYKLIKACSDKVFVTAAGNSHVNLSRTKTYPGCYNLPNIICVANSAEDDTLYSTSSYSTSYVDIAAPGENILSTYHNSNYSYALMSGTSMATPLVSSAVAALLSKCPKLTPTEAKGYILSGADYVEKLDGYVAGSRRLNAYKPIALALSPVTVTFNSAGGTSVAKQSLNYGECASEPAQPVRTGYDFNGWLLDGKLYDFTAPVTEDITLTASWTIKSFIITWRLDDNTLLDRDIVTYGTVPAHAAPEKESDDEYDYVFTGWTPEVKAVTGDAEYTAVYAPVLKNYSSEIELYDEFDDTLELIKLAGADGSAVIKVKNTGAADSETPMLVVLIAEYDDNDTLLNIERIAFSEDAVIPDVSGRNCRIFIWTAENEPVTECITDVDSFFTFTNTLD